MILQGADDRAVILATAAVTGTATTDARRTICACTESCAREGDEATGGMQKRSWLEFDRGSNDRARAQFWVGGGLVTSLTFVRP